MSLWKGKSLGNATGYKIFYFAINHLGLSIAYFMLAFVSVYYFLFVSKGKKPIRKYFLKIHNNNSLKAYFSPIGNYFALGQVLIDKSAIQMGFQNRFSFKFTGEENLKALGNGTKPGILIGAHVGNWQIARALLDRINCKFNLVMIDAEAEQIKKYLANAEDDKNVHIIAVKDDFSHIFEINKAIKNNEIVSFHGDRYLGGSKTVDCCFIGSKAKFPLGPFLLAAKFKVPVSFFFVMRQRGKQYNFYASEPIDVKEGNEENVVKKYVEELENVVRQYPKQWFNYYDFWKTQTNEQ